ncbi:hypothetical protein AGABI2DRAFT_118570 [Agaricus bisporus var. bisporus H97]|uniref:hypothetical protein n=1 Tax=Agaricus bisporus var. bisporus (strain H97 / ATCC MYA-4626 / FGSC 10389) TaxID=936046 RepID=UPI00029F6CCB|nr:hypothetical protein AGABI2DRAFT_118570 [Agaricus bisporus var. bisporus H97]EKV46387.1 hypothetical protein AGABI2DRAFT_118570 [Agaricus bisporus var. bisporus H97]
MGNTEELAGLDPRLDFFAGTVAGMAGLVVGFPFDTVKVRFQNPEIARKYSSTFHAVTTIIKEERFIGLFKGITSPLASVALMNGLVFASYRFFMKLQLENPESVPTLTQITLAGIGSGIVSSVVTTPVELIKIRQQSIMTSTTVRSVALQLYRAYGIPGLYRGLTATALRDCGYGAYFFAYEATCRLFVKPSVPQNPADIPSVLREIGGNAEELSWSVLLLAGGVAGLAGWLATFPFDVIKTRIQGSSVETQGVCSTTSLLSGDPHSPHNLGKTNPFRSTLSTALYSYKTEGYQVFFRGLMPTLIRWVAVTFNMASTRC